MPDWLELNGTTILSWIHKNNFKYFMIWVMEELVLVYD
jgi:hypothetical protein